MVMHSGKLKRIGYLLAWPGLLLVIAACDPSVRQNDLALIQSRGELVLITRNNTACYYEGPNGPSGFEYELAKAFANNLGVTLRLHILEGESEMITALHEGQGDVIAGGFPFGNRSAKQLCLGPGYMDVEQQVVGRRGGPDIRNKQALETHTLWMTDNSARVEYLSALRRIFPGIGWKTLDAYTAEDLLQMVWKRSLPLAVVDSNILAINHRYFPELVKLLTLGEPRQLRWATDPRNPHLTQAINDWFGQAATRARIEGLVDHYYSHLEAFDYVDMARFRRRIKIRLPRYRSIFEAAADKYNLDWQLVAALAYQESHWDPKAESYTGVRGMMMLTRETAADLGVGNRMDVDASILAGTRYLARLHGQMDDRVIEPDRTLLALAAYNIGFGHVQDARTLARRLGKQENSWHAVRSVLPLLQQKKYYRTLDHRYARGQEAVVFVDRIRNYYRILQLVFGRQMADDRSSGLPRHGAGL